MRGKKKNVSWPLSKKGWWASPPANIICFTWRINTIWKRNSNWQKFSQFIFQGLKKKEKKQNLKAADDGGFTVVVNCRFLTNCPVYHNQHLKRTETLKICQQKKLALKFDPEVMTSMFKASQSKARSWRQIPLSLWTCSKAHSNLAPRT